jgi:ketosteroid isomerase-like protein
MRLLLATALLGVASVSAASAQTAGGADEIKKLVHTLTATYKTDLPGYFAYYAPDTQMWWPTGKVDKKGYEERTAKRPPLARAEASDIDVIMGPSGDSALAMYILTIQNNEQAPVRQLQMSLVWYKRAGKWQIVHLHFQPKPEPKPKPSQ